MLMIIMVITMNTIPKALGCLHGDSKNIREDSARTDNVKLWEHIWNNLVAEKERHWCTTGLPFAVPAASVASRVVVL
ncbi:hypothetical protein M0802_001489 [Mischocyttarus mexicanus]|nr:hypothetical protein M0802_001489 [Mischocyttarus mexicanus]